MQSVPTVPVSNAADPALTRFRYVYAKTTGAPPTDAEAYAASFWDAMHMLARAMEVAGSVDGLDKFSAALRTDEVTDYPGRMMDVRFDRSGQSVYVPYVQVIRDGVSSFPLATETR